MRRWAGEALALQIEEGWRAVANNPAKSPEAVADDEASRKTSFEAAICAMWLAAALERGPPPGLSPLVALAALSGRIFLSGSAQEGVTQVCVARLVHDAAGLAALRRYWARAMSSGADDPLPHGSAFSEAPAAARALEDLLRSEPDRPFAVLRAVLPLVVAQLSTTTLQALVAHALPRPLQPDASAMWTVVGFMADPGCYETAFSSAVERPEVQALLDQLRGAALMAAFATHTIDRVHRDRVLIELLAPRFPPTEAYADHGDEMSQVVAAAVDRLSKTPTRDASAALAELRDRFAASAWCNLLRHKAAAQAVLRSEAEFRAPTPLAVSQALVAGRPATARDLQAVVSEILEAWRWTSGPPTPRPGRGSGTTPTTRTSASPRSRTTVAIS